MSCVAGKFGGGDVGLLLWIPDGAGVILGWFGRGMEGGVLLDVL